MMPLRRSQSEEEKAARTVQKAADREAKDRQKAAAEDQSRLRKEAEERGRQKQAFEASPAGQAREAFKRGDHLFQFVMDVKDTKAVVIPMSGATTTTTSADPIAILNSVCREGWDLVNGSFVFHELGSESRDKFLASGQNIAVRGTVIGYYLFRRCDDNKASASADAWDVRFVERACPHCGEKMQADARVCAQCHFPSDPWVHKHDRWWRQVDGDWHYLTDSGQWMKQLSAAGSAEEAR